MAQVGIREYDAKKCFFEYIGENYNGVQIKNISDLEKIEFKENIVIKPDMLFGKRGKYGLVGVNLDKKESKKYLKENLGKEFKIESLNKKIKDNLDVFIAEPFIKHSEEYYVSFDTTRDFDIIRFSENGGVDVEENWDKVKEIKIGVTDTLKDYQIETFFGIKDIKTQKVISDLFNFFRDFSCTYLEVNPFCFDEKTGKVIILDMVCKVDDCAYFLQKDQWEKIDFPNSFGYKDSESEKKIKALDMGTGASLKFKILNPEGRIWTLLSGGGGSLIFTDTIGALGFTKEIGNYGECSGNPDRESTREYTEIILKEMLKNNIKGKYLVIGGAIANFTHIDKTFAGIIDVFEEYYREMIKQDIKILIRRGGINDKKGLKNMKEACDKLGLDVKIADSSVYMTEILKEIKL